MGKALNKKLEEAAAKAGKLAEQHSAKRTRPCSCEQMLVVKGEFERELADMIEYRGQESSMRKLLLQDGDYDVNAIALMSQDEVANCIQEKYAVIGSVDEEIMIVERSRMAEFNALVKYISR